MMINREWNQALEETPSGPEGILMLTHSLSFPIAERLDTLSFQIQ